LITGIPQQTGPRNVQDIEPAAKPTQGSGNQPPDLSSLGRSIIEHTPLPMATVEGARHIVRYVNPAFCRLIDKNKDCPSCFSRSVVGN
jgi:hypothetical protein